MTNEPRCVRRVFTHHRGPSRRQRDKANVTMLSITQNTTRAHARAL
jgi:hypothetical protein